MEIHEYSLSKTLLFMVASGFAMLIMVFILLLFFSMISQGVAYFVSIVKEIINAHNEHINVISTPGVGSEFIFSLPKSHQEDEED